VREHVFVSRIDAVAHLHAQGLTGREIAERLGVTPPTVSYYLRRLGVPKQQQGRYDWKEVQKYYDEGRSVRECVARFGFSHQTWHAAKLRGDIRTRPHGMPIEELLSGVRNRRHIKMRLIKAGLKRNHCESCGLNTWMGAPLSLALHHVNGDKHDNRLVNLQLLCPNCHSQTDNFAGRNRPLRLVAAPDEDDEVSSSEASPAPGAA
jgi:DNA-binding transcriptional ArsR family regulator